MLSSSRMLHSVGCLNTDISRLPIGDKEPVGSPETSVLNQPTLRNIPEDDRIFIRMYKDTCCFYAKRQLCGLIFSLLFSLSHTRFVFSADSAGFVTKI